MTTPLINQINEWYCPNCRKTDQTIEPRPHVRLHPCPKMFGLSAPMMPAGTRCEVKSIEREDYVGKEIVRYDGRGRPIQSIATIRDNGQDAIAFAPTAYGSSRGD